MKLTLIVNAHPTTTQSSRRRSNGDAYRLWDKEIEGRALLKQVGIEPRNLDAITLAFYAWTNEIEGLSCELNMKHARFLRKNILARISSLKEQFMLRYEHFIATQNAALLDNRWIVSKYNEYRSELA